MLIPLPLQLLVKLHHEEKHTLYVEDLRGTTGDVWEALTADQSNRKSSAEGMSQTESNSPFVFVP